MDLKNDFIQKFEKLTSMKPVPSSLGAAKDGNYYWLYYAGMGQTEYHKLPDMEQKIAEELCDEGWLKRNGEIFRIPVFGEDSLLGEVRFEILEK